MNDYINAMREMNGKYVGNRPIKIKRSTWKDRSLVYGKSKIQTVKFKKKKNKLNKRKAEKSQNLNNNKEEIVNTQNIQNFPWTNEHK